MCSKTNINASYLPNSEKQKVTLTLQVFNEKAIAALNIQGTAETARFVTLVLRMWECFNIKPPETCYM